MAAPPASSLLDPSPAGTAHMSSLSAAAGDVVGSTPTLLSGGSTTERGPGHHRCLLLCGGGPVDVPAAARLPLLETGSSKRATLHRPGGRKWGAAGVGGLGDK